MAYGNQIPFENQRWGDILYRRGSQWEVLHPGTSGQVLQTQGINKPPKWGIAKLCYDAVVDPAGSGTHTTIQSALTAMKDTQNARILVFSGIYTENLVPPAGSSSHIYLEGCPPEWQHIWTETAPVTIGTLVAPSTGVALDLQTAFITKFDISGMGFYGTPANPTIKILPTADLCLTGCQVGSNSAADPAIRVSGSAGTGKAGVEIIRSYISGKSTSGTDPCISSGVAGGPFFNCHESTFIGSVALSLLGSITARECSFTFNGVNGVSASGGVFEDCIFNHGTTATAKAIALQENTTGDSFIIHGCKFYNASASAAETAIDLSVTLGTSYGTIGGNYFGTTGAGANWNIGINIGAGVKATIFANQYANTTTPVSGTTSAINRYESTVPVEILSTGTNGQVLTMTAGVPTWGAAASAASTIYYIPFGSQAGIGEAYTH